MCVGLELSTLRAQELVKVDFERQAEVDLGQGIQRCIVRFGHGFLSQPPKPSLKGHSERLGGTGRVTHVGSSKTAVNFARGEMMAEVKRDCNTEMQDA